MTKLQKFIGSAIAASALVLNSALPIFASTTDLIISGNGAESDNDINISQSTETTVVQDNTADISNNVYANSSTGDNSASKNTGGDVSVSTGDSSTGVGITNSANSNVANIDGCCAVDANVMISDNGAETDNQANLKLDSATQVFQTNDADISNSVNGNSSTGGNEAEKNTGGDVTVKTGDADTTVVITNEANANSATVGGGSQVSGSVSLKILGNGYESDNDINLLLDRSLVVTQDNLADISNKVDANSETGYNSAEKNTGGDVTVKTGDASTGVGIDNMANFNYADLDCGCILDVLAKVAGNGYETDNQINAKLSDVKEAFQTNAYVCDEHGYPHKGILLETLYRGYKHSKGCNDVNADSSTGGNETDKNTGPLGYDPTSVNTGDAATLVNVENTANSNVLSDSGLGLPDLPSFDFDFDFGFNWLLWWGMLTGNSS